VCVEGLVGALMPPNCLCVCVDVLLRVPGLMVSRVMVCGRCGERFERASLPCLRRSSELYMCCNAPCPCEQLLCGLVHLLFGLIFPLRGVLRCGYRSAVAL
jgi:hypothetical protein